jgi:hypothetical protein
MAKVTFNPVVGGMRGKSGGFVYRQVDGETFVSQKADAKPRRPTAAQKSQRERFSAAMAYARTVLSDPCQLEAYEALGRRLNRRADKLVTSDYLTPPVVDRIDVSGYQGQSGGMIRVLATDDVEVVSVEVAIQAAGNAVLERGPAAKVHGVWCYTATMSAPAGLALTITATAKDRPGNVASGQQLAASAGN